MQQLNKPVKRTLYAAAAAMIAISAAAFLPSQAMAQVDVNIVVNNAPPPPRYESVPQPRRGYVWAPGYWNWDGQRHVWNSGQWLRERSGNQYRRSEWVRADHGWRLVRGGWAPAVIETVGYDDIVIAPPPPRFEPTPELRPGYFWAPGHWEWRGRRYDWNPGVWIVERPGYFYSPPVWSQRGGRWYMEQGRWAPRGQDREHGHHDWPRR
ncbi:YXWGXW repeat-containing protein [Janthinobacterium agaricidamnosum]|uniref:YXWGXW repeat family protein n=1 Tax=Janthinobacterium agaricidamnosum NBRC 102515 = DSM 9628 TaxID=1349767 RepID=W0V1D3_9BURK|nr:YXWGXW repeat-containing protein [Janthinobacterium agaricidamnosum]CDG82634.1 putative uncharacterized protein [Janthinobacterium agaricidamnosum NBRC 102515 = DSM 9628]